MPAEFQGYGTTWEEHHPDWEMRLWTPSNLPPLRHPDALQRARTATERSDVLRYEVLWHFGGVYVDTDFECLRPLDPLLPGVEVFTARDPRGNIQNAILGAVSNHPLFERAVTEASQRAGSHEGAWHPGIKPIGPRFFRELVVDFPEVTVFESEKFYPYGPWETPRPSNEYADAYAIHHWTKSGRDPDTLTPEESVATIRRMRNQQLRIRERLAAAREETARARRTADKLAGRLANTEARLQAIEGSRWWRLRPRLSLRSRR
jgi:mannosyltransferase OCH1-like enzyme